MKNNSPTLLAIDQGTTSSRAILFSRSGEVIGVRQKDLAIHTPHNGWVEQKVEDILNHTIWAIKALTKEYPNDAKNIASIGITNQRETTILWNKKTGKAIYNAIVWQDKRSSEFCKSLKDKGLEKIVTQKTGLLLDPYFSATKIKWILDHVDGARDLAKAGDLAFGTVDSFLLWHLTGGKAHATDATNASRTMLFNIVKHEWDDELLSLFDIPKNILPDVKDNVATFGVTDKDVCGVSLPIGAMAGDQQAALFGQACFDIGMVKSTYGTGCFALMNIGDDFRQSKNRLLTTIAYRMNGKTTYALEGAIFVAGAAIQWLRDELHLFEKSSETFKMAGSVDDNGGVYFVPAFSGLGAPYWNADARGMICGLSRGTTSSHIVRAALEAQAYQTRDLMDSFRLDSGSLPKIIRADGGLTANEFMCQFLADQLNIPIEIPAVPESTALGVAYMAGLQAGVYNDLDDIAQSWALNKQYTPSMPSQKRDELYDGWKKAISRLL